jgi:hypothetical protein
MRTTPTLEDDVATESERLRRARREPLRRQGEEGLPLACDAYVELLVASGAALRCAGPGPALPEAPTLPSL